MDLVPAVDVECINNPIRVSFCDNNFVENTESELDVECDTVAINGDEANQHLEQHRHGTSCFSFLGHIFN